MPTSVSVSSTAVGDRSRAARSRKWSPVAESKMLPANCSAITCPDHRLRPHAGRAAARLPGRVADLTVAHDDRWRRGSSSPLIRQLHAERHQRRAVELRRSDVQDGFGQGKASALVESSRIATATAEAASRRAVEAGRTDRRWRRGSCSRRRTSPAPCPRTPPRRRADRRAGNRELQLVVTLPDLGRQRAQRLGHLVRAPLAPALAGTKPAMPPGSIAVADVASQ